MCSPSALDGARHSLRNLRAAEGHSLNTLAGETVLLDGQLGVHKPVARSLGDVASLGGNRSLHGGAPKGNRGLEVAGCEGVALIAWAFTICLLLDSTVCDSAARLSLGSKNWTLGSNSWAAIAVTVGWCATLDKRTLTDGAVNLGQASSIAEAGTWAELAAIGAEATEAEIAALELNLLGGVIDVEISALDLLSDLLKRADVGGELSLRLDDDGLVDIKL